MADSLRAVKLAARESIIAILRGQLALFALARQAVAGGRGSLALGARGDALAGEVLVVAERNFRTGVGLVFQGLPMLRYGGRPAIPARMLSGVPRLLNATNAAMRFSRRLTRALEDVETLIFEAEAAEHSAAAIREAGHDDFAVEVLDRAEVALSSGVEFIFHELPTLCFDEHRPRHRSRG